MDDDAEEFWKAMLQPEAGPIRSPGRPRWQAQAACRGVGTELFFPGQGEPDQSWRAFCDRCEVTAECLDAAMESPATEGNWAGTTRLDRAKLRRSSTAA